jgi:hypothetical protein
LKCLDEPEDGHLDFLPPGLDFLPVSLGNPSGKFGIPSIRLGNPSVPGGYWKIFTAVRKVM